MFTIESILFSLVVMVTYFVEGIVGFGATIFALPIISIFIPLKTAIPLMTNMGIAAPAFVAVRDRRHLPKEEFLRVLKLTLLGLPIGMLCFSFLPERILRTILSVFMIFVGTKNLYQHFSKKNAEEKPISKNTLLFYRFMVFFGGIVQGAFSCGGPFIVIYLSKFVKDKTQFRTTLATLWVLLNSIVLVKNFIIGIETVSILTTTLIAVPLVYVSLYLSNIVHKKCNGEQFLAFVNVILLLSGIMMFLRR